MKRIRNFAVAIAMSIAILFSSVACSSTGSNQLLTNLQTCERTYQGQLGGLMPGALSVTVHCDPVKATVVVPASAPAAPAAPVSE